MTLSPLLLFILILMLSLCNFLVQSLYVAYIPTFPMLMFAPSFYIASVHPQHCNQSGPRHRGDFDKTEYLEDRTATVGAIKKSFIEWYKELYSTPDRSTELRVPLASRVSEHRRTILGSESLRRAGTSIPHDPKSSMSCWDRAISNKTCFACLQSAPDHVMPCGHGFCDESVKDFGGPHQVCPYHFTLTRCVFCLRNFNFDSKTANTSKQLLKLIPKCTGIRVLALDGGGIRGIVELAIFEKVESRIGLNLPVRDLFDLVTGTSTGT